MNIEIIHNKTNAGETTPFVNLLFCTIYELIFVAPVVALLHSFICPQGFQVLVELLNVTNKNFQRSFEKQQHLTRKYLRTVPQFSLTTTLISRYITEGTVQKQQCFD